MIKIVSKVNKMAFKTIAFWGTIRTLPKSTPMNQGVFYLRTAPQRGGLASTLTLWSLWIGQPKPSLLGV